MSFLEKQNEERKKKFEENNNNHPDNEKLKPGEADGPAKTRRPRDIICCLLLIAHWVALTGLGLTVTAIGSEDLPKGNPDRLINGMDYMGNICGIDTDKCGTGKDTKDTDDCRKDPKNSYNTTYKIDRLSKAYYLPSGVAVCVSKCPTKDDWDNFYCQYDYQAELDYLKNSDSLVDNAKFYVKAGEYVLDYKCMPKVETTDYIGYCVPKLATAALEAAVNANVNMTSVASVKGTDEKDFTEKIPADLYNSLGMIAVFGFIVCVLVGFVYLTFLRLPGVLDIMIWGTIIGVGTCIVVPGLMLAFSTAPAWKEDETKSDTEYKIILYVGYLILGIGALYWCCIICLRSRINLAVAITKEAARAVRAMPFLILFPVVQCAGLVVYLVPWCFYALYLMSSGEVNAVSYDYGGVTMQYKEFSYSDTQKQAGLYLLFSWFWTSQFVVAMGQLVNALAVSQWYFTRQKSAQMNSTVIWAIKTAFVYHMGSAAFGSLIIAIIKTIRAIVAYIQRKANEIQDPRLKKIALCVLCCIQCCLWCIEKCMKFINKNAYIQIAIFGYSFCKAARKAFFLILRNILRITAVAIVSTFVTALGKMFIVCGTTFIAYLYFAYGGLDLYTLYTPLFFVFFICYFVSDVFLEVFEMAISTILQCFCADEEMFKDNMFAEGTLESCISGAAKKSKKAAAEASKQVAPAPENQKAVEEEDLP